MPLTRPLRVGRWSTKLERIAIVSLAKEILKMSNTPVPTVVDMLGAIPIEDSKPTEQAPEPAVAATARLVEMSIRNLGCIGPEPLIVELDKIVCLVGRNNSGKSTILRAYELAQSGSSLSKGDRCMWTPDGDYPEVELSVHIPDHVKNIDARWRMTCGDLRIVRSKWTWKTEGPPERKTWDPTLEDGAGGWAEDGKAAGADNVFKSRLPKPLRVDSLRDAIEQHDDLLKLVLEPISSDLKVLQNQSDSPLSAALKRVVDAALEPVANFAEQVKEVSDQVAEGFSGVFPELKLAIKVAMEPPSFDLMKSLLAGSAIKFDEGTAETGIRQQGSGSRRALFWTLLRVHNLLAETRKLAQDREKEIKKAELALAAEQKKKKPDGEKIAGLVSVIEGSAVEDQDGLSLPGHILLIDEPENCLHPMAVRAARNHLYALAKDSSWQVVMSTHSPFFIDPLADHTTIVRLHRDNDHLTPKTFRTSAELFSDEERENLRALIQLDSALAEMFFGSYPILVEGDTELAAFIAAVVEPLHPLGTQVSVVPARGKALLVPLVKLLSHFKIDFGILHDLDAPLRADGATNGSWTMNSNIVTAIFEGRAQGLNVRHRVSVPDFERFIGDFEGEKDKPIIAYKRIKSEKTLTERVQTLFQELYDSTSPHPSDISANAPAEELIDWQRETIYSWAEANAPTEAKYKRPNR
jgi:energy-coupling factor transporter ATP-binding protein EcfA2